MSWRKKVVWSEGMLLQPQHLQQHERHTDHVRHVTLSASTPYAWGFSALEIDTAALALGKLALLRATGVFADGTVFDMPAVDPLPDAVDIPSNMRDEAIVLALPLRRAGAREADVESFEDLVRHRVLEQEVPDSNTAGERTALLQLGQLHTRLLRHAEHPPHLPGRHHRKPSAPSGAHPGAGARDRHSAHTAPARRRVAHAPGCPASGHETDRRVPPAHARRGADRNG